MDDQAKLMMAINPGKDKIAGKGYIKKDYLWINR